MTPTDALGVGVRIIGVYWISNGLEDFLLAAVRAAGAPLGGASSAERDIIFGALNILVGLSVAASARELAHLIYAKELPTDNTVVR